MKLITRKGFWALAVAASLTLAIAGCRGSAGQNGLNGTNGTNGTNGSDGSNGAPGAGYAIDATTYTPDEWGALTLKATVTSLQISSPPVVSFTVTDGHNVPVKGLGFKSQASSAAFASYANMAFGLAKLVPGANGSPSIWVNYIVTANPTAAAPATWVPTRPTTDNIGTLVDNGDGSYRYTFRRDITQTQALLDAATYTGANIKADLGDVSYNPNLTHRLTVFVGGTARGTGTNTPDASNSGVVSVPILNPANAAYDFIPATGVAVTAANEQRDIVDVSSCFSCHAKFEFHGSGRQDTRYCVICHNDQRKYGQAEATVTATTVSGETGKLNGHASGDFPSFIHRIHMGEELTKTGYAYGGIGFNEVTYPQDHRNCVKCHSASATTPQGDNWFNNPSRFACGGCHDRVDWTTGANHAGGAATSDVNCSSCHGAAGIKLNHLPVVPPDPANIWNTGGTNNNTNASFVGAFANNLPPGASKVTWDLKSVTLNAAAKPVFTFRFLKDGVPVVFNTYAAGSVTELMDNFVGGPSFYIAFSVPQDGIANPADWNATASTYLKNIWRGDNLDMGGAALAASAQGTLSATPDASGYYTLTMTGVNIPTSAGMVTGGIGYTYALTLTQPLTQTNVPGYPYIPRVAGSPGTGQGGLSVPAPNVSKVISGTLPAGFPLNAGSTTTGPANTARRTIVANAKCLDCHGAMGVFTTKAFHAGQRNDPQTCEFCHNGQRVNNGWGVNMKDFVHAIHGAGKRQAKFSWEASAGDTYWKTTYPGVLNNCEACHIPGTYDFGLSTNAGELPDLLWTTVATGTVPTPVNVVVTGSEPIPGVYWSPYAAAFGSGFAFGTGFSYNANTGATTAAAGTTLVNSPYVAACSNCHDSSLAIAHMQTNGGTFYGSRASVTAGGKFVRQEQCFLCHSAGKIADVRVVHMTFK